MTKLNPNWIKRGENNWELNLANVLVCRVIHHENYGWRQEVEGAFNFPGHTIFKQREDAMMASEEIAKHVLHVATQKIGE